ncbi:hypothetical protein BGZ97_002495 [Linnemannia gamsii]|uniref:F-box domain-containing protein n=1 Tax=Linnemannia gamsii TaxID=64522 RepID=A0A9P6UU08_9FUNG|nr:hypothetical protein BGZ97_002495 [Linnemannia gamsii]
MDPISQLPVECLEHILRCIGTRSQLSISTLAALRLVNQHLSKVTLPFLLEDLFKMHYEAHHPYNIHKIQERVRTLLSYSTTPITHLYPALAFELFTDNTSHTTDTPSHASLSQTDYIRHVRSINLDRNTFRRYDDLGQVYEGHTPYSDERMNYIHSPEFMSICPLVGINPACPTHSNPKMLALALYPIVVYRQAIWALASPTIDQVVSLSIPMSDIRRYHGVVARLGKLEFIHVVVDLYYDCGRCGYGRTVRGRKPYRREAMRDLVQFVIELHQRFPGRLKTVTSSDSPWMRSGRWCAPIEIDSPEIQRCFDWAVQERRDLVASSGEVVPGNSAPTSSSNSELNPSASSMMTLPPPPPLYRPALGTRQLVPLTNVKMHDCNSSVIPDIASIGFAFSSTLEVLSVHITQVTGLRRTTIPDGRAWVSFPCLCLLEICAPYFQLALGRLLPEQCPLLALIKIQDGTREYSCRDIIPFNPGHFPELNNLELMGSNALSFNPATLASTKKLVTLKLYMPRVHCCFIPPIDELRRSYGLASEEEDGKGKDDGGNDANTSSSPFTIRPQWTWDWQLPALTHLYLNAEFAYWFEFKACFRVYIV